MQKTIIMERMDDKETKGCYRYGHCGGDTGPPTLYIQKVSLGKSPAPRLIEVTIHHRPE